MSYRSFLRSSMKKEFGTAYGSMRRLMKKRCNWAKAHRINHVRPTLHNMVMIHLGMFSEIR